jgi:hypothetical protein
MPQGTRHIVSLLAVLVTLNCQPPDTYRFSSASTFKLAQAAMGSLCQTQFGVCPLLDPNGQPIWLPVGSACFCGQDPGQVRQ